MKNLYVSKAIGQKFDDVPFGHLNDKIEEEILKTDSNDKFTKEKYTTFENKHFVNLSKGHVHNPPKLNSHTDNYNEKKKSNFPTFLSNFFNIFSSHHAGEQGWLHLHHNGSSQQKGYYPLQQKDAG